MGVIKVENIRVFAYHGCLTEESKIGSDYRVDLTIKANLKASAKTDDLADTVDYVFLNRIVREEMKKPSHLLENVAKRILKRVMKEEEKVTRAVVEISKLNPPIGGDVQQVTIKMVEKRK